MKFDFFLQPIELRDNDARALEWSRLDVLGPAERHRELLRLCAVNDTCACTHSKAAHIDDKCGKCNCRSFGCPQSFHDLLKSVPTAWAELHFLGRTNEAEAIHRLEGRLCPNCNSSLWIPIEKEETKPQCIVCGGNAEVCGHFAR